MGTREDIRRLIQEGKVSEEEGTKLFETFEAAESRDRVIRAELSRVRATRRGTRLWTALGVGVSFFAFGFLVSSAVIGPSVRSTPGAQLAQEIQQLIGGNLDLVIGKLEHKLRQPGSAVDYRLLGIAYERRSQESNSASDRQRAAEALARAERMERRTAMRGNPAVFGLLFVFVVVTAIVIWIMAMYNGLARSDEQVNERWAQVETALQRRLDLIPQLVETVKGYTAHERETLLGITQARARVMGALEGTDGQAPKSAKAMEELSQAQQGLSGAVMKLLALAEHYPDLKANEHFRALQDQLEGTENRIAVERQRYNDGVRGYNARLRVFPSNVVGGMFGYEPREYFESKVGAEEPVAVKF